MKSMHPDIVWPPLTNGYTATLAALTAELRRTQYLPPEEIQRNQGQQLQKLIAHHYANTPSFADRLRLANLAPEQLASRDALRKLPPINKSYIQQQGTKFTCEHVPDTHKPTTTTKTSGSTGEPITVERSAVTQLIWEAMAMRDHEFNNRDYSLSLCALRANIDRTLTQPVWGIPVARFYQTGPSLGMNIGGNIDQMLHKINEFQPGILVCHAGVLQEMVMIWESQGFQIPSLRHIKNIGDMIPDGLRQRVRAITGLEIEDNYSSSETGAIAIQCKEGQQLHLCEEALIVEVLDDNDQQCQPGAIGRVVITDLHNWASPVIRYDIGDLAQVGTACKCGRTLGTLSQVVGRQRNIFIRPDGTRFWPKAGMYDIPKIIPIRQWQIIQHSADHIEYKLVSDHTPSEEQVQAITELAAKNMGYSPQITVTVQKELLPRSPSGKFEESICLIER